MDKICTKCHQEKNIDLFPYRNRKLGKLHSWCKACASAVTIAAYSKRPPVEPPVEGTKVCNGCNLEKSVSDYAKRRASADGLTPLCKICKTETDAVRYKKNRRKRIAQATAYAKDNREAYNAYRRDLQKRKETTNINYRLSRRLRSRLYKAVVGLTKAGSAIDLLGCTVAALKLHLEASFYCHPTTGEVMDWSNYGAWHIDHKKPLDAFDLSDHAQLALACHHTNLQPLWEIHNLTKGSSV